MSLILMFSCVFAFADGVFSDRMQQLMPVILAMMAVVFMMLALRKRQRKDRTVRPTAAARRPPEVDVELRRDMDDLLVELQQLSRKISAEIDTRFAKLEAAIRDADRRIAVLHRLAREANPGRPATAPAEGNLDSRHSVVYELADAGFSNVEIARELGKTPGEVELILNLRKAPQATAAEASKPAGPKAVGPTA